MRVIDHPRRRIFDFLYISDLRVIDADFPGIFPFAVPGGCGGCRFQYLFRDPARFDDDMRAGYLLGVKPEIVSSCFMECQHFILPAVSSDPYCVIQHGERKKLFFLLFRLFHFPLLPGIAVNAGIFQFTAERLELLSGPDLIGKKRSVLKIFLFQAAFLQLLLTDFMRLYFLKYCWLFWISVRSGCSGIVS